jgi:hypothetical protein
VLQFHGPVAIAPDVGAGGDLIASGHMTARNPGSARPLVDGPFRSLKTEERRNEVTTDCHPSQTALNPQLSRPKNGEPLATLRSVAFIAASC